MISVPAGPFPQYGVVRPGTGLGQGEKLLLVLAVGASFLISPALLFSWGVNYASSAGALFEKLHIATMLVALAVGWSLLLSGRLRFVLFSAREFALMLALIALAALHAALLQRPVTSVLVTFLTPVLLLYLLQLADAPMRHRIRLLVMTILLLNSLVGLAEFFAGTTLLPRIAGTLEIHRDTRALGLVGNPLSASFLAGFMLVYLVITRMMTRFDAGALLQIGIHGAALMVFGGRLALLATLCILSAFVLFDGSALRRRPPVERWVIRYCVALVGCLGALGLVVSGLAGQMLARFAADGGSAATRRAALDIVLGLDQQALLLGLSPALRAERQAQFGTPYGIEITWLAWLVNHGLLVTIGLVLALAVTLRACLRGADRVHVYLVAYFLVSISGAQGLGAKSLLLAWVVTILLTFRESHSSIARSAPR